MKQLSTALVAIDAKYTHTNLAVRSIRAFVEQQGLEPPAIAQFTVNQRTESILTALYNLDAQVYLFSCYIWNIRHVCELARDLAKIRPKALLLAGGPEVSCHSRDFLRSNPVFYGIIRGEGEPSVAEFIRLYTQEKPLTHCPGLTYFSGDKLVENPEPPALHMDILPFAYMDLDSLQGRIPYYESMRGCPFSCTYCLSSLKSGVRFRDLQLVFSDLSRFLQAGVRRVKFVDRTFNCNPKHAMAIWQFLKENDNGITNFHFELAGDLLTGEMLEFLAGIRPGLFQFEIGVQSCNPKTLEEIQRPAKQDILFHNIRLLQKLGNIHLHLDLIAGLPYEGYCAFVSSFNTVYALLPHQFQLGFLKVLKGSAIEASAKEYGIQYREKAPYQVLSTNWLSFGELAELSLAEQALDRYYNSGRFAYILSYLVPQFPTPYDFYRALGTLWEETVGNALLGKTEAYDLLAALMQRHNIPITLEAQWLCKLDIALHQPVKKLPQWVTVDGIREYRQQIRSFYNNLQYLVEYLPNYSQQAGKSLERITHLEVFPFDPDSGAQELTPILLDYEQRDVLGHAAMIRLPKSVLQLL